MLVAHMDEIGVMVKGITERGLIFCSFVGYTDPITLLGEKVKIPCKSGFIHGVITTEKISNNETVKKVPKMEDLWVDAGLSKEELLKNGVEIGSYLYLDSESRYLGSDEILAGKSLDDRIGCYILMELAKRLKNNKNDIFYVFTVQEEIGLYGAQTSVYHVDPNWAIVVDVTHADDLSENPTKIIGKGPCATIKDEETLGNKCIINWLKEIAKEQNIPLQLEVSDLGSTDALNISVAKGGIPCASLNVAVRNMHTTSSIVNLNDVNNAIKLLENLLKKEPRTCTP